MDSNRWSACPQRTISATLWWNPCRPLAIVFRSHPALPSFSYSMIERLGTKRGPVSGLVAFPINSRSLALIGLVVLASVPI